MGKRWGSNENIHIGDIYKCDDTTGFEEYYQVTALRGKSQVVLRAIAREHYINEDIPEDSPIYWRRERTRPLPGQFRSFEELGMKFAWMERGVWVELTTEEVTAWVLPERFFVEGRPRLQAIGPAYKKFGIWFERSLPEDWEPWDAEAIRELEEDDRRLTEAYCRRLRGEDVPWPEHPI